MTVHNIKLPRGDWTYDDSEPLGSPGGFGAVFRGTGAHGPVAVKRLFEDIVAEQREVMIAEELIGRRGNNIITLLDAGNHGGYTFIIMELAEYSLRSQLSRAKEVSEADAAQIVAQLLQGLRDFDGIVHRDLKPENVLFSNGRWKIADFGIGRLADVTTDPNTLKRCKSPPYAAPEQWRMERATVKTDLYAIGCIAFELTEGRRPFVGPDFSEQHQFEAPPTPINCSPLWANFVLSLLAKPQLARPSLENAIQRIGALQGPRNPDRARLTQAAVKAAQLMAVSQADAERQRSDVELAKELAEHARVELLRIVERMRREILNAAPDTQIASNTTGGFEAILGKGRLSVEPLKHPHVAEADFKQSHWHVVCAGRIAVETEKYARSASLLYADVSGRRDTYRWYEVAYFQILGRGDAQREPTYLPPGQDADGAASSEVHSWTMTPEQPRPIDWADQDAFVQRWLDMFAQAVDGSLSHPRPLPENM